MAKKPRVSLRHSAEMAALHQHPTYPVSIAKIRKLFPQYSQATIYRHTKMPVGRDLPVNKSKFNKGRPRKLTEPDCDRLVQAVEDLRNTDGTFTSPRIAVKAELESAVSNRTIRRALNRKGYKYLTTRRKGIMTEKDFSDRVQFCKKVKAYKLGTDFWTKHISFYMDGTGFEYKTNPRDQARAPSAREWRKQSEGLVRTGKGKKEGVTSANFMVGIAYGKGVVLCDHYEGAITGEKMETIVENSFEAAFSTSANPEEKRVLTDGCPRQTSKRAMLAYTRVGARVLKIPSRSPDLNPIENFFHLAKKYIKRQAIERNITRESYRDFCDRVKGSLLRFSTATIDNIISSMEKRIDMVLQSNGHRIKY